jgi:hypothetical protein
LERPYTTAKAVSPPPYEPLIQAEEEPKSRKWWYIGCGCLLLLVICILVLYLGWTYGDDALELLKEYFPGLAGMIFPFISP